MVRDRVVVVVVVVGGFPLGSSYRSRVFLMA